MKPIEAVTVSMRFGDITALDGVSISCERGTITGIVGHNGAGKSTLINLFAGLLQPVAGSLWLHGAQVGEARTAKDILRQTGFLLEDEALFEYLTGREFLHFVGYAFGLSAQESDRRATSLETFFALEGDLDRLIEEYSSGMRKKTALAAALIATPSVLILDEPFESLDPAMVRRLRTELRMFCDRGGTVFLSSHLLHTVQNTCDHMFILDHGRIVAEQHAETVGGVQSPPPGSLEELYARVIPDPNAQSLQWLEPSSTIRS